MHRWIPEVEGIFLLFDCIRHWRFCKLQNPMRYSTNK